MRLVTMLPLGLLVSLLVGGATIRGAEPVERAFLENRGQTDQAVNYYVIGARTSVYFTDEGPVLTIRNPSRDAELTRRRERRLSVTGQRFALRIRLADPSPSMRVQARSRRPARQTFLFGGDTGFRASQVGLFDEVVYRGVRPGIDLVYRLRRGELTYEIVAAPGADAASIGFVYEGAIAVTESTNDYRIATPLGTVRDRRPGGPDGVGSISISEGIGTVEASAATPREQNESGLRWSTFLGGQSDDTIYSVDLDDQMRPVVTGTTASSDFPTSVGALDTSYAGSTDVFVSKFDADGSTLLWSTFLGADGDDRGWVVRLDSASRPVIAGVTGSTLFPTTAGAFDQTYNEGYDAFVAKLSADGSSLVFSTFFGGGEREWDISGLVLDGADRPLIVGSTRSSDLPTSPGALDDTLAGTADAFVTLFSADGSSQVFGTYLGGGGFDAAESVALDSTGRAVVAGWTYSDDYPVTPGALQTTRAGTGTAQDCFVTKLAQDGNSLVFSTYLGGDATDEAFGVALDDLDRVLVTGRSESANFPTTAGSFEPVYTSGGDAFVAKIATDGTSLLWGTYLGGLSLDSSLAIVVDTWNQPVIAGWTCSDDLPMAGASYDATFNGTCDGFVSRFSEDGASLLYGSYLGWWFDETIFGLAVDDAGRPVVGGRTTSLNFPTTPGAYDTTHNSLDIFDGFLSSLLMPAYCTYLSGSGGSTLTVEPASGASCRAGTPTGELFDVIEGRIDLLGPGDIGPVQAIACGTTSVVFATDTEPLPGQPLFQLARESLSGSYTDGGGSGLVGGRVPASGDCP